MRKKPKKCVETYYAIKLWPRSEYPYFATDGQNTALFVRRADAVTFAAKKFGNTSKVIKKVTLSD